MTKTSVLSACARRDHVAHFHLRLGDDYPINQQFDEPPLLLEARTRETLADPAAVVLHATHHPAQLIPPLDLLLQLPFLTVERRRLGFDLPPPPLILFQLDDAAQIRRRQPLELLLQPHTCFAQACPPCLQLLRQPLPAPRSLQLQW